MKAHRPGGARNLVASAFPAKVLSRANAGGAWARAGIAPAEATAENAGAATRTRRPASNARTGEPGGPRRRFSWLLAPVDWMFNWRIT